jgi:hypothetical protein
MTRDQKIYYYQNLLLLSAIPFIAVLLNSIDLPLPKERKCLVYHENAPTYDLRCELEW